MGLLVGLVLDNFGIHLPRVVAKRDHRAHFWTCLLHYVHFQTKCTSFFRRKNVRMREGVRWWEKVWQSMRKWRSVGHEKEDNENVIDLGSMKGWKCVKKKQWEPEKNGDQENENDNKTLTICFSRSDIGMDGWMERWMDGCKMDETINGGMDDWLDGWMDGWNVLKN